MVITGIKKKRGRLLQLEFDSLPSVAVDIRTFEETPYQVGSSLNEKQLDELVRLSNQRRSMEKALYLLSFRDYSRRELEQKLLRETDSAAAAAAVDRMEELGLINDGEYAKKRAGYLLNQKLYPSRRAVEELCALGIDRETSVEAVDSFERDDVSQALALLNRKYYNMGTDNDSLRKVAASLSRFGFDSDTIRRAINEFKSTEQDFELDD